MATDSEREREQQRRREPRQQTQNKKSRKKSMAKDTEKEFAPRKELPFPFEKELFQNQVKSTPAVIKEFIPINDSDNCKVIVFLRHCGLFVSRIVSLSL